MTVCLRIVYTRLNCDQGGQGTVQGIFERVHLCVSFIYRLHIPELYQVRPEKGVYMKQVFCI